MNKEKMIEELDYISKHVNISMNSASIIRLVEILKTHIEGEVDTYQIIGSENVAGTITADLSDINNPASEPAGLENKAQ